jgi:hypothetical protein
MSEDGRRDIIEILKSRFPEEVLDVNELPSAYCADKQAVKAILLGCDPGNAHSHTLRYAFGIGTEIPRLKQFFAGIESNLQLIGFNREQLYIHNLCQNYFIHDTYENKVWKKAAIFWIPYLKEELDQFPAHIPVLLTSSILYDVLVTGKKYKPPDYYECRQPIPIQPELNRLGRPLIPFYRNRRMIDYHLSNTEWHNYKLRLIEILNT